MKTQNVVHMKNGKSRMMKEANWDNEDIKIELNAHQFESDELSEDPQGEIEYKSYRSNQIIDAFKDFLKYIDKGYEDVELSIYSYKSDEVTFNIRIKPKDVQPWTTTDVSASDINAEKLAKIQQIIQL